jgi:hypothetical protein
MIPDSGGAILRYCESRRDGCSSVVLQMGQYHYVRCSCMAAGNDLIHEAKGSLFETPSSNGRGSSRGDALWHYPACIVLRD